LPFPLTAEMGVNRPKWSDHALSLFVLILKIFHILHVFDNHQRNLERNGIFKNTQVQIGAFLQFIQTVHQRVSVNVELT
jgi:hypothetical protein